MKPTRRPFLVTLALSLLAGAGFSIALAVGFAAWSDAVPALDASRNKQFVGSEWDTLFVNNLFPDDPHAAERFERLLTLERTDWAPKSGATEYSNYQTVRISQGVGLEVEQFHRTLHYETPGGGISSETAGVLSYRSGWPFKCLRTHQWSPDRAPQITPGGGAGGGAGNTLGLPGGTVQTPPQPPWFHAAEFPSFLVNPNSTIERKLPLVPAWPGLLANTACFTGLLLVTFPVRHAIIRRLRHRRNHCLTCNYDRVGLEPEAPCPECGSTAQSRPTEPASH
jgi:hypothetical protein